MKVSVAPWVKVNGRVTPLIVYEDVFSPVMVYSFRVGVPIKVLILISE